MDAFMQKKDIKLHSVFSVQTASSHLFMIFGGLANFTASIVFLALISKAHLQDCKLDERRLLTSREKGDVLMKSGSYMFNFHANIILESTWNHNRLVDINIFFGKVHSIPYRGNVTVNVSLKDLEYIESIDITLHNVTESESGEYILYDRLSHEIALQCWTLYILGDKGETDDYLEDGTFFNFTTLPSLSDETAARMNITTSWLIGDRDIDPGQPRLVERSMDNKNLTYLIHEQSNRTIAIFISTLKVSYTDSIVFDPQQDTYILAAKEALPSIRCYSNCSPGCNITWYKGTIIVSDTDVLSYPVDGQAEFLCYVTNPHTGKQLNRTLQVSRIRGVISVAFDPKETFYKLKPGEKIPDIRCTAKCYSTCNMTWSKNGAKITDAHVLTSRSSGASGEYTCLVHDAVTETNQTKSIFIHYEEEASQIAVYLLAALVGVLSVTSLALATCLWRHVTCTRAWTLRKTEENDEGNVEMAGVTEQYEDLQDTGNADNMYDRINPESQHRNQQTVTKTYENMAMAS